MNGALNDETAISPSQPSESEQSETTVESNHENLSKETTKQYKDYSGVDTESFIIETLRDHPKDRGLLLSLEKFFQDFIQDDQQMNYQFQAMNSYERMIVHRVAAYFGLHHNTDKNAQCVVISKTPNMRIPELSFRTVIENQSTDFKSTETTNRGFRENKKPIRMNPTKPLPTSSQLNSSIVKTDEFNDNAELCSIDSYKWICLLWCPWNSFYAHFNSFNTKWTYSISLSSSSTTSVFPIRSTLHINLSI